MNTPRVNPGRAPGLADQTSEPLHRRRCDNCPKFFQQQRRWQRFCSPQCRKEFHYYGSSYGKLKETTEHLVHKAVREQLPAAVREELAKLWKAIDELSEATRAETATALEGYLRTRDIGGHEGVRLILRAVEQRRRRLAAALQKNLAPGE